MGFRPGQVLVSERITSNSEARALQDYGATADIAGPGVVVGIRFIGASSRALLKDTDGSGTILEDITLGTAGQAVIDYEVDKYRAYTDGLHITTSGTTVTALEILYRPDPA